MATPLPSNEFSEAFKVIVPAAIGAGSAILVFVVKDLWLTGYREKRARKLAMLDRRISQLYAPLIIAMKGGTGMLGNILKDDQIYEKALSNLHLLSPELQRLFIEYTKLGSGVRSGAMTNTEGKEAISLSQKFNELLLTEWDELREQFKGGFWRKRICLRKLLGRRID